MEQRFGFGGEADELKAVTRVQVVQAEAQGPAGLLQLPAGHGTGGVQHEADILGLDLPGGQPRGGKQKEEAFFAGPAPGEQADAYRIILPRKHQPEIGVRPGVTRLPAHHGPALALASNLHVVGRTEEAFQRLPALDAHADRNVAERCGAELLGG